MPRKTTPTPHTHTSPQSGRKSSVSSPLMCTRARRNPATCGTNQGSRQRGFAPTLRSGGRQAALGMRNWVAFLPHLPCPATRGGFRYKLGFNCVPNVRPLVQARTWKGRGAASHRVAHTRLVPRDEMSRSEIPTRSTGGRAEGGARHAHGCLPTAPPLPRHHTWSGTERARFGTERARFKRKPSLSHPL